MINRSLISSAYLSLLIAQFISAFADNAIFIAAIAWAKHYPQAQFHEAILQAVFLAAYIALAPYVGPYADGHHKSRVMFASNNLKLLGAIMMLFKLNPIIAYSVIGIGAAAYSPAKYGILLELLPEDKLVKANSFLESSTIVAIITGVVYAGWLADYSLSVLIWSCVGLYFLASVLNLFIPKTPIAKAFSWRLLGYYSTHYLNSFQALFSLKSVSSCIIGTTTFWSTGILLRLLLFAWIPLTFMNKDNSLPANLMGMVSIGIAIGATCAGFWINLSKIKWAFYAGLVFGPLIFLAAFIHYLPILFGLMALIGFFGGAFMVPLNAVIQKAGAESIGTGTALAIQNFCENGGMLAFSLTYLAAQYLHASLFNIFIGLGFLVSVIMLTLAKNAA